jgi:NAD(P)-dependent dehydrogenase (short-subunit alcohol dehydrogenase family)
VSADLPSSPLLADRIALVTGATRGIGRAIALGFAAEGAHVIALGRTQGALEALDDDIRAAGGERATLVPLDLADGDGIDRLGAVIFERWGKLDICVAAAGLLGVTTPVAHLAPKVWDQVIAVNLTANYRLIRSMDLLLRKAEAGRLVLLTSGAAARPRAFWGPYAASKAGLEALAAVYADETDNSAVRVAVVNPGPMRTRMRAQAFPGEDPQTLPAPEEIVPLILDLVRAQSNPPQGVISFPSWREAHAPPAG